jgi:hypothetical protein
MIEEGYREARDDGWERVPSMRGYRHRFDRTQQIVTELQMAQMGVRSPSAEAIKMLEFEFDHDTGEWRHDERGVGTGP